MPEKQKNRMEHPIFMNADFNKDYDLLYSQVEVRLEDVVDKLLRLRDKNNGSSLLHMQGLIERIFIRSAMRICDNNISKAAKLLGINRNTLSKKLKEF